MGTSKATCNRVWIELDRPTSDEEGHLRAQLASTMLTRLGSPIKQTFWWHEKKECYCVTLDTGGSYQELQDNGHWFNLDFLGTDPNPVSLAEKILQDL